MLLLIKKALDDKTGITEGLHQEILDSLVQEIYDSGSDQLRYPYGYREECTRIYNLVESMIQAENQRFFLPEDLPVEKSCDECGGLGHTIGFLGSKKVTYPCSKGC